MVVASVALLSSHLYHVSSCSRMLQLVAVDGMAPSRWKDLSPPVKPKCVDSVKMPSSQMLEVDLTWLKVVIEALLAAFAQ